MGQDSILQWVRKLGEKGPRSELELLIQNTPTKKVKRLGYIASFIIVFNFIYFD